MSGLKTIFKSGLTSSETTAQDSLGDIRQERTKRYKYVKFTGASNANNAVKYATLAAYTASEVAESATQALIVAGVTVATQAANDFGWIQIQGAVTMDSQVAGTPIVQTTVTGDNAAGDLTKGVTLMQDCGISIDTTTGVLLNCPD